MHVVFRESHGLEETDTPMDLGQDPAEIVVYMTCLGQPPLEI